MKKYKENILVISFVFLVSSMIFVLMGVLLYAINYNTRRELEATKQELEMISVTCKSFIND